MLEPAPGGTRRRHVQAAELGLLDLHHPWGTGDDSARVHRDANSKPRRACQTSVDDDTDRALKASPAGGLRPALTALPVTSTNGGVLTTRAFQQGHAAGHNRKPGFAQRRLLLTKPAASDMPNSVDQQGPVFSTRPLDSRVE